MVTCGYCKDCRWWEVMMASVVGYWGQCHMADSKNGERVQAQSRAVARDYEEYVAYLDTAPDFGCVQFGVKADREFQPEVGQPDVPGECNARLGSNRCNRELGHPGPHGLRFVEGIISTPWSRG